MEDTISLPIMPSLASGYTNVWSNKQLSILMASKCKNQLLDLITKRIGIHRQQAQKILSLSPNDNAAYEALRITYGIKPQRNEWGTLQLIEGRANSRIKELAQYMKGHPTNYLDVGGGNCEIAYGIGKHFALSREKTNVIDIADYCSDVVRDHITFTEVAEDTVLPFADNSFELITCFQVLHHMKDIDLKLKELYRVLAPGSIIIVREHDCANECTRMLIDVEHLLYDVSMTSADYNETSNKYYAHYRSKFEWTSLIESYGFTHTTYLPVFNRNNPTNYYYDVFTKK